MIRRLKITQKIYLIAKTISDPIISAFLLILASPFFLIIAILIKKDSEGAAFTNKHIRIVKDHKFFVMYKFRTMKSGYENITPSANYKEHMYKMENDPRITKIGKFLRKYDLDELPQLINILKGEMFFIGPRCFQPEEEKYYKKTFPGLREQINSRTRVKPGLTGLWQVSGRNKTTLQKRLELDNDYIEKLSPFLDLKILFKTFQNILKQKWH